MYNELYTVWKRELESLELQKLSRNFYYEISSYLKRLREEGRMLDKKTAKAKLLEAEIRNVKFMVQGLMRVRFEKIIKKASEGQKIPPDTLTVQEEKIFADFLSIGEVYRTLAAALLQGHNLESKVESEHKMVVLRFSKEIPEIIGADMKVYGPFKAEDVASIPVENAKILIRQGLAEKIESA